MDPDLPSTRDVPAGRLLGDAERHAHRDVARAHPGALVGDVVATLHGHRYETLAAVAVLDGDQLKGLVRLENLLDAPADSRIEAIMDPSPPTVGPGTDQEAAAWTAIHRGESCVAVVDDAGRFVGLIPPPRLIEILLAEHDEDLARLGGYLRSTQATRTVSEEKVLRRYWHRLPWLFVGLVGALLAAEVVGFFEASLQASLLLAFFLPGLVYMADAVGTQTETIIVRGLSVGVPIRRVARLELATGLLVGVTLAAAFIPFGLWRWGDVAVVATVAISMVAACSVATVLAMALPALLRRLGADPAFGSGPLATVAQDLLTIVIYLGVAQALLP
jgi:magnesium transporter